MVDRTYPKQENITNNLNGNTNNSSKHNNTNNSSKHNNNAKQQLCWKQQLTKTVVRIIL